MITGTVIPVSVKEGILFLPVAEKELVSSVSLIPVKSKADRNLAAPYPDISKINLVTTLSVHLPTSLSPLMVLDTVLMEKNAHSVNIPVKTNLKGQTISGSILSGPGISAVVQPLAFLADTVIVENAGHSSEPYQMPENSATVISTPLDFLDTSGMKKKSFEESYSTPPPAISGLKSQTIHNGTLVSSKGISTVIESVSSDSLAGQSKENSNNVKMSNMADGGLTGGNANLYGTTLPPPAAVPPAITHAFRVPANPVPVVTPLDFLDTTSGTEKGDFVSTYTTPPIKINLKSQNITGSIVATHGQSSLIEPISPDSLLARQEDNNRAHTEMISAVPVNAIVNNTGEMASVPQEPTGSSVPFSGETGLNAPGGRYAYSPSGSNNSRERNKITNGAPVAEISEHSSLSTGNSIPVVTPDKTNVYTQPPVSNTIPTPQAGPADNDVKFNFFVNQYGRFAIRISSNYFYLNISQSGKLTDYAILEDGQVTGSNTRMTQSGKTKVTFDNRGWVETIAGEALTYTYDGRVNKVGNIYINYDNEGKIIKVGNIDISFNYNGTVDKFANYRVGYIKRRVIGIDDSNGLVIYRPEVEDTNNNKPNF
jgi:hypothetical protein